MARGRKTLQRTEIRGKRVFIYVRISSIRGREDTYISDEIQIDRCRRYCEREGLKIVGEPIMDIHQSGRSSSKRKIHDVIKRIGEGEADGVVVWKISRWGRNTMDSMKNIIDLRAAGGFIRSTEENLDDENTPMGNFNLGLMLGIAQLQSDEIGQTWKDLHAYRVSEGYPPTGGPRFGYYYRRPRECRELFEGARSNDDMGSYIADIPENRNVINTLLVSRDEMPLGDDHAWTGLGLAEMYQMYLNGTKWPAIVDYARAKNLMTTENKDFSIYALTRVMDSGFGAGKIVLGSAKGYGLEHQQHFPGVHQAVITEAQWQAYIDKRSDKKAPHEKIAVARTSNLIYCGVCGKKMFTRNTNTSSTDPVTGKKKNARIMYCQLGPTLRRSQVCSSGGHSIRLEAIEAAVKDWLDEHMEEGQAARDAMAKRAQAASVRSDVAKVTADIAKLKKRIKKMAVDWADNDDSTAEDLRLFQEMKNDTQAEIKKLEQSKKEMEAEVNIIDLPDAAEVMALQMAWEAMPAEQLNAGLVKVVGRILIEPPPAGSQGRQSVQASKRRVRVIPRWELTSTLASTEFWSVESSVWRAQQRGEVVML